MADDMLIEFMSLFVSGLALIISAFSIYRSYFDHRVTLTVSLHRVGISVQGTGSSTPERTSRTFRYFADVSFVLASQGTRPVVITDVELVSTGAARGAVPLGEPAPRLSRFEPCLVDADSLQRLSLEFELPRAEAEGPIGEPLQFDPRSEAWALRFTVFDPSGRRREPFVEAFSSDVAFRNRETDSNDVETQVEVDVPRHPQRLLRIG